jgi:tetratricopeptide (TPR) repeat protein
MLISNLMHILKKPAQSVSFPILIGSILFPLVMTSCAYLRENLKDPEPKKIEQPKISEREQIFNRGEVAFKNKDDSEALPLFLAIARDPSEQVDPIYEKSLMYLGRIYERTDQSEKAILAFNELLKTKSAVLPKISIQILLIKNHYRVSNYYQAKAIRSDIDADYKMQKISLEDLFNALYYETDLYYDRHVLDELLFLGDVQKYFVYVIESDLKPQSEKATDLLILDYKKFVTQLESSVRPSEVKKNLMVSLINQLNKFERYKMEGKDGEMTNFNRFSNFANETQLKLTERLANGKF